ncbi:MAG TPA: hypothetical protein VGL94_20860 [Ktedonobacteraceae bacterium]
MLIFNDEQRLRAGIKSLSKRCPYCSKALAAYLLILSDDAGLFVYHAACADARRDIDGRWRGVYIGRDTRLALLTDDIIITKLV